MLYGGVQLPGHPDPANIQLLDTLIVKQIGLMSRKGIAINIPLLNELSSTLAVRMADLRKDIVQHIPPDKLDAFASDGDAISFNVESPQQLGELLFNHLGVGRGKRLKTTKSGDRISTGKKQLETIKRDHPVISLILQYRECSKLKSTYTDALPQQAKLHNKGDCRICGYWHAEDHPRIHTSILTTRTDTGRLAAKRPNLMQIPARSKLGREVRKAFVAERGKLLIGYDFAQIELRLLAHAAQEQNMINIFKADGDIHTHTAMRAFELPEEKVDKMLHRAPCKNVNFGICIAEGQLVLTDSGLVPIERVSCWNRVWDGDTWVSHSGVKFNGYKEVIEHDGLVATADHQVWVEDGRKMELSKALAEGLRLAVTGIEDCPIRYNPHHRESVAGRKIPQDRSSVQQVQNSQDNACRQYLGWQESLLYLSGKVRRREIQATGRSLLCDSTALWQPGLRLLSQLRRSRNSKQVRMCGGLRKLRAGISTTQGLSKNRYRSEGERRSLRTWKPETVNSLRESVQPPSTCRVVKVYDILNAGPNRRFTCQGKLVSNCYGLGPPGLYDLMAVTYAVAEVPLPSWLDVDWCERFIQKWFDLYPSAKEYFDLQHYRARRYGITWCMFGGVRRIPEVRSVHERVVQAGLRQAGNNPIQRGAAGVFKLGMARTQALFDRLETDHQIRVDPLLPIHDELIVECDEDWADAVGVWQGHEMAEALRDVETGEYCCRVPIGVDGKTSERWEK